VLSRRLDLSMASVAGIMLMLSSKTIKERKSDLQGTDVKGEECVGRRRFQPTASFLHPSNPFLHDRSSSTTNEHTKSKTDAPSTSSGAIFTFLILNYWWDDTFV
jgi:hypothetical protein